MFPFLPSRPPSLLLLLSLPERIHRFRSIQPPYREYQHIGHGDPYRARRQDLSRQRQGVIELNDGVHHREPHQKDTRNGGALPILNVRDGVPCISDREVEDECEKSGGEKGIGGLVDEGGGDGAENTDGNPDDWKGLGRWPEDEKGGRVDKKIIERRINLKCNMVKDKKLNRIITYIQEGRFLRMRFLSSFSTLGRELSRMEKTRDLKLMKAKKARTTHKLTCLDAFNLMNAVSMNAMTAVMVANCNAVATTQVPSAPHCTGGPLLETGRSSR